ncbi:MAG: thioredoxin family protein [Gammaproteobacteria bacterium]|nr:thioredoxin family protein [Gammaproteobacteria bacterium]
MNRIFLTALNLVLFLTLVITSTSYAKDYYVGEIEAEQILADFTKFQRHQNDVEYSKAQLKPLQAIKDNVEIKVFFGQWCHDSQREVPRIIKLFDQLNNPKFDIWYYGLNTSKSDPDGFAEAANIKRTPTVVIYKDGNEIARILEFPKIDWATDLSEILR